ncbi:hypothetical protein SLEP1_g34409 [Rubroshorea leprosula]|uniref:Uncharacterized protein n=1 Tax=Rubroshorea leprosula TaxID=152421 RepID=A0AAV5KJS6_9ROSI|nr:hypothetical protein SLEP1_g34409 [Rubroshorea leprosula]
MIWKVSVKYDFLLNSACFVSNMVMLFVCPLVGGL